MQESKAALRYARSLFSLALERNELEKVSADMELIDSTIKANRDLAVMLQSPVIKAAFLDLIIRKRREMYIAQIARQFVLLHLANNGVEEALLITAVPADADLKAKVIALVEKQTGNKVVLEEKVDPSVIGGFVLRYGDKQLDTSLGRELQDLKREFARNLYVKDY